jgi:putative tryptophan/tyrosine transport system substrate-binding protein
MIAKLKRREFITLLGGAAVAWPLAARAQQPSMPVIGYLSAESPQSDASFRLAGLRHGMTQAGYVEGRNLVIEYRWAEGQLERLPALAAELVQLRVAVIIGPGLLPTLAAKTVTTTIPILFSVGVDPVPMGLVASLNRPGGNLTGFNVFSGELGAKGLAVLHELVPSASTIGFLANPRNRVTDLTTKDVLAASHALGIKIQVLKASIDEEIDAAFANLAQARTGALLIANDLFLNSRFDQLIALAARHAIPAMYPFREFTVAGGLMSYGTNLTEGYRQLGVYVGRILGGEKPADLPVVQSTKIELIINLKTARALGLEVPAKLLALADAVIE